jgi:zinc protease
MTLPQAKQLITKFIDGGKLVYMITGDAKTQLERLQDLGLGKVIMLDRNGGVVKP